MSTHSRYPGSPLEVRRKIGEGSRQFGAPPRVAFRDATTRSDRVEMRRRHRDAQLDHNPISFPSSEPASAPPRFPSITHIFPSSRQYQVSASSEMLITLSRDCSSVENVSQIDETGGSNCRRSWRRRWENVTVGTETTDASIWVHRELEVSHWWRGSLRESEKVTLGGPEGSNREKGCPLQPRNVISTCALPRETNVRYSRGSSLQEPSRLRARERPKLRSQGI